MSCGAKEVQSDRGPAIDVDDTDKYKETIIAWLLPSPDKMRATLVKEVLAKLMSDFSVMSLEDHTVRITGMVTRLQAIELGKIGLEAINGLPPLHNDRLRTEVKIIR